VTVTVSDSEASASTSFGWSVTSPNNAPTITNPGNQTTETGVSVNLAIAANDADGDTLTYSATGLPAGLGIDAASGVISGAPTTAGPSTVTVTVSDGEASTSASFTWTVVFVDTTAPSIPGNPDASTSGGIVQLSWAPSTDDVGVTGYIVYRSDRGNSSPVEIGRTASTSFSDSSAPRGGQYFYSVRAYDAAGNVSEFSNSVKVRL
jgi:fibronectin type 3 domain-containing protein